MAVVHVLPVDDSAPHLEEGAGCRCGVDVEMVKDPETGAEGRVITHHSFDGRERTEAANEIIRVVCPETGEVNYLPQHWAERIN